MNKVYKARRSGFTLVELLIVTVIIGILAGMMMLTMGTATDGAEASRIVNDLRLVKSAALLYYTENDVWPYNGVVNPGSFASASLDKYMDKDLDQSYENVVYVGSSDGRITYGIARSPSAITAGIIAKLQKNGSVIVETVGGVPVAYMSVH